MSGWEQLSREELLTVVAAQAATIEALQAQNALLTAQVIELTARVVELTGQVAELQARLAQNSRNSSRPPSSDPPSAQGSRAQRRASKRAPGKQPGTPGTSLTMSDTPDQIIDHVPAACGGCGADLTDPASGGIDAGYARRQVVDLPEPVAATVTEYRLHRVRCGCGHTSSAPPPAVALAPVAYGPRVTALVAYLVGVQHLPYQRAVQLVADLFEGLSPSTGWACTALARTAAAVGPSCQQIASLLRTALVLHADETSTSIGGKRWWLHVACTPTLTAFHLDPGRGRDAVAAAGILPGYSGVLVHDALAVYDAYTDARHALCGAHLLRELTAAAETHPDLGWPDAALDALGELLTAAHAARDGQRTAIPAEVLEPLLHRWTQAVAVGLAVHPRVPGRKQSKTRNLLQRLHARSEQVLLFARDLRVPFSNNQAERDLRPAKTQLKISGCHRSAAGARSWLAVRGYAGTCRKNGVHVLTALYDALMGDPWMPSHATT